jgi:hypothetical protein
MPVQEFRKVIGRSSLPPKTRTIKRLRAIFDLRIEVEDWLSAHRYRQVGRNKTWVEQAAGGVDIMAQSVAYERF